MDGMRTKRLFCSDSLFFRSTVYSRKGMVVIYDLLSEEMVCGRDEKSM